MSLKVANQEPYGVSRFHFSSRALLTFLQFEEQPCTTSRDYAFAHFTGKNQFNQEKLNTYLYINSKRSVLNDKLIDDLGNLSLSPYVAVRKSAQRTLDAMSMQSLV